MEKSCKFATSILKEDMSELLTDTNLTNGTVAPKKQILKH